MIVKYGKPVHREILKAGINRNDTVAYVRNASVKCPAGKDVSLECPVCASSDTVYFTAIYDYLWRACNECKCAFVSNPPPEFMLRQLYEDKGDGEGDSGEFTHRHVGSNEKRMVGSVGSPQDLILRAMDVFEPKVDFAMNAIERVAGTWLDIACGTGEVPFILKQKGWRVTAVDPNEYIRNIAKEYLNVDVMDGLLDYDLVAKLEQQFDVVSLFNILEHLTNPREAVSVARKLVKVGGSLVIEVPHFPNLTAYLGALFPELTARVIAAPYHLFMFSMHAISAMLKENGFEVTGVWFFGQDFFEMLDIVDSLTEKGNTMGMLFSSMYEPIQQIMDENLMSECMVLVARRKG